MANKSSRHPLYVPLLAIAVAALIVAVRAWQNGDLVVAAPGGVAALALLVIALRINRAPFVFSRALKGHRDAVLSLAITPNGRDLLSGAGWEDPTVRIWRLGDGRLLRTIEGHTGAIYGLAVTDDGALIASGGADGLLLITQLKDGASLREITGHADEITGRIWSLPGGRHIQTLSYHEMSIEGLAVSPDGSVIAAGSVDQCISLWRRR